MDKKTDKLLLVCFLVGAGGFEPPKAVPTDLQSAPFGHSGTLPHIHYSIENKNGAGGRTRTPDLLITNQLLYQLSYTSVSTLDYYITNKNLCQVKFSIFLKNFKTVCLGVLNLVFICVLIQYLYIDFLWSFSYNVCKLYQLYRGMLCFINIFLTNMRKVFLQ